MSKVRIFTGAILRSQLTDEELRALIADFKAYKSGRGLPDTFGRDVPYDHAHTLPAVQQEKLRHLHLAEERSDWSHRLVQFNRTSDTHLIYCHGIQHSNHYALLAILSPDAHRQALDKDLMLKLARSASLFRNKH